MKSNTREKGCFLVLYAPRKGTMFRWERRLYARASFQNRWVEGVNRVRRMISVFVVTHHSNPIAVKANVTAVRLDGDSAALEGSPPYVCESPAVNRGLQDVLQIRWA